MATENEEMQVAFGAQADDFMATMSQIRFALQGLANPVRGIRDNLGELADAFIAAFAVDKLLDFVDKMTEAGEQALKMAAQMGESVEKYEDFAHTLEGFGGSMDNASRATMMLERNLSAAADGVGRSAEAYRAMGISQDQIKAGTQDLTGFIEILRQKWQQYADDENKSAMFTEALGGAFRQLIPYLIQTDEEVATMRQRMADTGSELSDSVAKGLEDTGENIRVMDAAFEGLGITLFETLKPAFDEIILDLTNLVEWFNNAAKSGGEFHGVLDDIGKAVQVIVAAVEDVVQAFIVLGDALNVIDKYAELAGADIHKLVTLGGGAEQQAAAYTAYGDAIKQLQVDIQKLYEAASSGGGLSGHLKLNESDIDDAMQKIAEYGNNLGGEKQSVGFFNPQAIQDAVAEAKAAGDEMTKVAQATYETQVKYLQERVSVGKMTDDEMVEQEIAAQQVLTAAQVKALEMQAAVQGQQPVKYKELQDQIAAIEAQGQQKILQLKQQGVADDDKLQEQDVAFQTKIADEMTAYKKQQAADQATNENQSASAKRAIQLQAINDQYAVLQEEFTRESTLYEVGTKQYLQIWEQFYEAKMRLAQQAAQVEQQYNKQISAQWDSVTKTMTSSFDTMLRGVLQGTQTWQQALRNMFDNLVMAYIESLAKQEIADIAHQLKRLLLEQTTDTAITGWRSASAADQAAADASAQLSDGSSMKHAARAAQATFDYISQIPYVGPFLAPAAAAAAFAAVMAFGSFAQGAWEVPQDMIAAVHADEMIVPASTANQIRAGADAGIPPFASAAGANFGASAGSGGSNQPVIVQFSVQALDSQSVANLFKSNGAALSQTIATMVRNGNSNITGAIRGVSQQSGS